MCKPRSRGYTKATCARLCWAVHANLQTAQEGGAVELLGDCFPVPATPFDSIETQALPSHRTAQHILPIPMQSRHPICQLPAQLCHRCVKLAILSSDHYL